MLNRTILGSLILLSSSSVVFASGAPYVGADLGFNVNQANPAADIFAGYGWHLGQTQRFYLGLEASLGYQRYDYHYGWINQHGTMISSSGHLNRFSLGGSLIPGIMLNDKVMLYGRVEVAPALAYAQSKNVYANLNMSALGLGLQANVARHWDMRLEADRQAGTSTNLYKLGFVYKFD